MRARLNRYHVIGLVMMAVIPSASLRAAESNTRIDEVALRYYATQKQTVRAEAEIRRLQKLHPGWQPPADLWTLKAGTSDDRQLWDLFAANKLDDLHAAIAARRAKDSDWRPSADLELKLRRKELRPRLIALASAKRWREVIIAADRWRSEIAPDDLEALWLVAEAYARSDYSSEALQVFETAMKAPAASDRVATLQHALALQLPMSDLEQLMALGRTDPGGRNEFDAITVDITRARISALLRDLPVKEVSAADYTRFQEFAGTSPDPSQSGLLGWYALKQSKTAEALDHFKAAITKGGDATVAQGLVIALRRLGRLRDAEEVAYAWRTPSPANMTLFLDVVADQLAQRVPMEAKRLVRYADVTLQTASGEGAEALGWYAYDTCQTEASAEWFKRAAAWLPRESAILGYALALQRLRRTAEVVQLVNRYDGLFPAVVTLAFPDDSSRTGDRCQPQAPAAKAIAGPAPKAATWSSVPAPNQLVASQDTATASRGAFPVAVTAENPLRPSASERSSGTRPATTAWRAADPFVPVTDARRVAGVGVMPYERLGRTVLPGIGGLRQPSAAPGSMLQAPKGTLGAAEPPPNPAPRRIADSTDQFSGISSVASATATDRFHH